MMKLSVEREVLLSSLDSVRGCVSPRTTIPILSNVLLVADKGGLHITATNMDAEGTAHCAADVARDGALTIPAQMFTEIVKRLPKGAVLHLEAIDTGARVVIKSGRSKFHIGALPSEHFPSLKILHGSASFSIEGAVLAKALSKVRWAASSDEKTRFYLAGAYMHVRDGQLVFVATDCSRLARYQAPAPEGSENIPAVIVPSAALTEFEKLAGNSEHVTIAVSSSFVSASGPSATISTKTIEGSFPDYARVIPTQNDRTAIIQRADVVNALARVVTVATERGKGVKCEFSPKGALDLSVTSSETGTASDSIDCEFEGSGLGIFFNSRFFADCLAAIDGDQVQIKLNDEGSPALLSAPGDDDLLVVLMPTRW